MPSAAEIVRSFLDAVEARDVDAVVAHFAPDATWQNVPHAPAVGRSGVRTMLAGILGRSERVRWDVVTASYAPGRAWLERVDRFWIDGVEYAVECNGVLEIDEDVGVITQLRDYVDLGEWRARLAEAEL
ncbi:MAG: limonene-1,2-epoxide hydrolase family protein [Actinomycetota bacterium]